MSDGPDNFRDEELSRRYRALPAELPHPDTDAAIQAAARQALDGARRRPRSTAFYGGLAMAASVTLMMAVLLPSWRSGELQEQVAVQAPQQPVESADLMQDAPAEVAAAAPATPVIGAPAAPAPAKRARVATEPVAKPLTVPVTELAEGSATASVTEPATGMADRAAAASAPMAAPMAEADAENAVGQLARQATVAAEAKAEAREQVADSARAERSLSQKARRAMAPAAAPAPAVAMAPMPAQETPAPELERMVAATDALLLSGRYAEALARLQVGPVAADAALDSRRDLLRLLVPGESRVLQCTAAAGPASAQALCRLLQQYQAVQRVPAAVKDAVRQALLGEGSDPAPLLHAIADLPEAP